MEGWVEIRQNQHQIYGAVISAGGGGCVDVKVDGGDGGIVRNSELKHADGGWEDVGGEDGEGGDVARGCLGDGSDGWLDVDYKLNSNVIGWAAEIPSVDRQG